MLSETLKQLFTRDLLRLKKEIESYSNEQAMWKVEGEISNSGGNLCLHLIGNLKAFIGEGLGKSGYVRQRDHEFSGKNIPRNQLFQEIDETIDVVNHGLSQLTEEQLFGNFPIQIWAHETKMEFTLIHLHCHLNYHLGQINYHRRLLDIKISASEA
jgi:hypothetical protein